MSTEDPLSNIRKQNDILIAWKEQHNTLDRVNCHLGSFYLEVNELQDQGSLIKVSHLKAAIPYFEEVLSDYTKSQTSNKPDIESQPSNEPNMEWVKTIQTPIRQIRELLDNIERSMIQMAQPILIVTVTKIETQAVLKAFSAKATSTQFTIGNKTYYNLGTQSDTPIFMMQTEAGTATPGGALSTISRAIQDLDPQAVIMCGTAYGLRPDKQKLGDILIARQLKSYELQKIDEQLGPISLGDRITVPERVLDRFSAADISWSGTQTHFGLVLSGEKRVNNPTFRDSLLKVEPEAIGVEMEGTGLYIAARPDKVDWILVKAICNWANENKDDTQELAADNVAQFVLYVMQHEKWNDKHFTSYRSLTVASCIFSSLNELFSAANDLYDRVQDRMTYVDDHLRKTADDLKRSIDTFVGHCLKLTTNDLEQWINTLKSRSNELQRTEKSAQ
jgi:nucleoside phosphorylase